MYNCIRKCIYWVVRQSVEDHVFFATLEHTHTQSKQFNSSKSIEYFCSIELMRYEMIHGNIHINPKPVAANEILEQQQKRNNQHTSSSTRTNYRYKYPGFSLSIICYYFLQLIILIM